MLRGGILLACIAIAACRPNESSQASLASPAGSATISSAEMPGAEGAPDPAPAPPPAVRVEDVDVPGDLPAVVVRGERPDGLQMLFLAGMCSNPGGYVTSFQRAAAAHGDLVAVQGDVSCGGEGSARRWSSDLEAMDDRIDAAFVASGLGPPRDVVVIGYSQGAERGERLVGRWPAKYTSAVLMASPVKPSRANLSRAHAAVLMAGTLDTFARVQSQSALPLLEKALPVTFIDIPGARHGEMGTEPETTMDAALDFILDSGRAPSNR